MESSLLRTVLDLVTPFFGMSLLTASAVFMGGSLAISGMFGF